MLNPAFSAFVTHYHCRPIICQRAQPQTQTKGKVERPFQYVEGNLLCGREFQDLEDLRACARWWLKEKCDMHRLKTSRYGLESVQTQFLELGEHAEYFLRGLKESQPKNAGFHARTILHLKERYHCDDISSALAHAGRYHAYDCKALERILSARFQPRSLEAIRNERAADELRKALPKIEQRSLAEYSVLFNPTPSGDKR